jgi:hypothetical protein
MGVVGILNQLLRAVRLSDESWCCETCHRAALAGRRGSPLHVADSANPGERGEAGRRETSNTNKP